MWLGQVMLDSLLSSSNLKKLSKTILGLFWNVSNCFNGVEMWLKNLQGNVRLPIMLKTLKTKDRPVCKKNTANKTKIARKVRSSCWCIYTPSEEFCQHSTNIQYFFDCKSRLIKFYIISCGLQSRAAYILFFTLSKDIDDAQLFLGYVFLDKALISHTVFSSVSRAHPSQQGYDEQKAVVVV